MSLSPDKTDIDCKIHSSFPAWTHGLIRLGYAFAKRSPAEASQRITFGFCLPRIEFAAFLISLGIIKFHSAKVAPMEGLENLRSLYKSWVSYRVNGEMRVGLLDRIPNDEDGEAIVIDFKGRIFREFEEMTLEERLNYVPPKSGGCGHVLSQKDWLTIKPIGREFRQERGARRDQVRRIEAKLSTQSEELIGRGAADWLLSSKDKPIEIFGCKSRLEAELQEDIPYGLESSNFKFSDLLRPAGMDVAYPRTVIKSQFKIGPSDSNSPRIIEANRTLQDNLQASMGNNRIVLLSRSEPSYEDAAQILKAAFHERAEDFPLSGIHPPVHIKVLAFRHR